MHVKTRVSLVLAASGAAVGAMLVPATTAAAAAPAITITWATQAAGLLVQSGDTLNVSGTGFPASSTVYIVECSTNTGTATDCDQDPSNGGVAIGQTDANGAFTQGVVAVTETLGSATCGAGDTCYLAATTTTDPTKVDPNTNYATGSFTFDRLQLSPRTNLKNGQAINVVGGHFKAGATVYVSECTSTDQAKAQTACDFNNVKTFPADANGAFTGTFTVHTGVVGSDGSKCVAGGVCYVAGTDNIFDPTSGNLGAAQVRFAPAPIATSLTAKSTKSTVAAGHKFAIKGVLSAAGKGLNGATVKLYKVTSSGLKFLAKRTTATNKAGVKGAYKFGGLTQKRTSRYQTKFPGATIAGVQYSKSASKVVKVVT